MLHEHVCACAYPAVSQVSFTGMQVAFYETDTTGRVVQQSQHRLEVSLSCLQGHQRMHALPA